MSRNKNRKKAKPRPGAAKLNLNVDEEIGRNSGKITKALIDRAVEGNPTALHLIIRWAEDAEFANECLKNHGSKFTEWIAEIEAELAASEAKQRAETESKTADVIPPTSLPQPS